MKKNTTLSKKILFLCIAVIALGINTYAQDACSSATTLTADGNCTSGTTGGATVEGLENTTPGCQGATLTGTYWYKFVATKTKMYVQTYITAFAGATWCSGNWTSTVYHSTSCIPTTVLQCVNGSSQGSGDAIMENILTNLVVGDTYFIQIGYGGGGPCKGLSYCVKLGETFSDQCVSCSDPCGPGCAFTTTPTQAQLDACSVQYDQLPYSEGSEKDTFCYTMVPVGSSVSIQVANYGTCGGGVSSLNWTCQAATCSGAIQSGTLSNMNITGLTVGTTYTVCIYLTIPSNCYYVWYKPYFVGAVEFLPIELTSFTASPVDGLIKLDWETASETNSDYFSVERSADGKTFESIGVVPAAGTSNSYHQYTITDSRPIEGLSYYRLLQVDLNGASTFSNVVSTEFKSDIQVSVSLSGDIISVISSSSARVKVINLLGETMWVGKGEHEQISTADWSNGNYFVVVTAEGYNEVVRVVKTTNGLVGGSTGVTNAEQKTSIETPITGTESISTSLHLQ